MQKSSDVQTVDTYNAVIISLTEAELMLKDAVSQHKRVNELQGLAHDYIRQARLYLLDALRVEKERSRIAIGY